MTVKRKSQFSFQPLLSLVKISSKINYQVIESIISHVQYVVLPLGFPVGSTTYGKINKIWTKIRPTALGLLFYSAGISVKSPESQFSSNYKFENTICTVSNGTFVDKAIFGIFW